GGPTETQRLRHPDGGAWLHRQTGTPAVGMVSAGQEIAIKRQATSRGLQAVQRRTCYRRDSLRQRGLLCLAACRLKLAAASSYRRAHELRNRPTPERQEQEHGQPPAFPAALP